MDLGDCDKAEEIDDISRILYGFQVNIYCRRMYVFV